MNQFKIGDRVHYKSIDGIVYYHAVYIIKSIDAITKQIKIVVEKDNAPCTNTYLPSHFILAFKIGDRIKRVVDGEIFIIEDIDSDGDLSISQKGWVMPGFYHPGKFELIEEKTNKKLDWMI